MSVTQLSDSGQPSSWVRLTYASPGDPLLVRLLIEAVELSTGRRLIERLYNEIRNLDVPPQQLWGLALQQLSIRLEYDPAQLEKVPKEGPVVFIANHPFGVVDGLILGHLVAQVRREFVVLVNEVLCRDERLAPFLLPVDFRETREALQTNLQSRQQAILRMKQGQALAIFPAGGVATARPFWGKAEDLEWKRFVIKLIRQTRATVVPLFVPGRNSRLFHLASQISQPLRLSLLLHETRNKIGRTIPVTVGDPIPYPDLEPIRGRQELLDHLRKVTFALEKTP